MAAPVLRDKGAQSAPWTAALRWKGEQRHVWGRDGGGRVCEETFLKRGLCVADVLVGMGGGHGFEKDGDIKEMVGRIVDGYLSGAIEIWVGQLKAKLYSVVVVRRRLVDFLVRMPCRALYYVLTGTT